MKPSRGEVFASRLTAAGRSAVCVIGLRGENAAACVESCFQPARERAYQPGQIRYGVWNATPISGNEQQLTDAPGESVVVTPITNDHFEIHAHGGVAAVTRILQSLGPLGVTTIDAEQFTASETTEPVQVENENVLMRCATMRNTAVALDQCRSGLAAWLQESELKQATLETLNSEAKAILAYSGLGLHLCHPYRVVLAGPPNVGKSSLINRLVGYGRSITHGQAGTTRDVVECDTVISGLAIRFSDTAGIREGGGEIEREGIRRGAIAVEQADLVVIVVDPSCLDQLSILRERVNALASNIGVLEILNQRDRLKDCSIAEPLHLPKVQTIAWETASDASEDGAVAVDGIKELSAAIVNLLRPEDPPSGIPIPTTARQVKWLGKIAGAESLGDAKRFLACLREGAD